MRKSLHFRAAAGTVFFSLIGVAAVICLWYLAVRFTSIGLLLPTPGEVLERLLYTCTHPIGRTYTLPMHLLVSLRRVLVGFCLSAGAGVILGIAMGRFQMVEAIFVPCLSWSVPFQAWHGFLLLLCGSALGKPQKSLSSSWRAL
ncbi:MAG: hypothetical protein V8R75_05670 [Oscillospiraceae bacterium]